MQPTSPTLGAPAPIPPRETARPSSSPLETIARILRDREPNFLRCYLNPHVAQACYCLDGLVRETWHVGECQSFLANSLDEALGGAIKLVRYNRPAPAARADGWIVDPEDRLAAFAAEDLPGGDRVEFLPGLRATRGDLGDADLAAPIDLVVLAGDLPAGRADAIREAIRRHAPAVIVCVGRDDLDALRGGPRGWLHEVAPDVVVFDETFTDRAVPFGAFTARRTLFAPWNRLGKGTFHSTTFQPNTISALQFMNVLARRDPEFLAQHAGDLRAVRDDLGRRADAFGRYYNPTLLRLIRAARFETKAVEADGPFVAVDGRRVYDAVGGVACSVRGHNPPRYLEEIEALPSSAEEVESELRDRLRALTGLGNVLPAVSGAGAVENALKLALIARGPRRHVLALKAGFGGKTLLSLAATANPSYKERIGPLHPEVHYVDPFAADARAQVDALLDRHDFAAVQLELIQSVGGVRAVPEDLVRHLDARRRDRGYLLVVDEVQTGMYRTGPFVRSAAMGLEPDLLLLGKAASDMMFPTALTLYSDSLAAELAALGSTTPGVVRRRFGYDLGSRTVLNVLRLGESLDLPRRVADAGEEIARRLREGLGADAGVREVRVFGLLVGIELDATGPLRRRLRRRLGPLYALAMLRHRRFPVLAGICQCEPETLKITPPLDSDPEDVRELCGTIVNVLKRPFLGVLAAGLGRLIPPFPTTKRRP
ncbi:aminotransferase class III-fold pyridoxal phosphate-dependent enzyme [Paludisphaera mucosa]|uniref:Aminotransferase class III-fold pyridoxal phosphate-dependent enzyme n=1 Tax=Paludisphaera mucosa TaxID=3030827 RepID=A0ABT6FB80_9BACT|nr:aminotransferase class III-fold pyridoxal phosphate-dependent enzyme [Paludisphaera mucosa]MDG3004699.1 aminotransferase class III-fold pyridoxal phosphate-dependent enzyme [Paludisphaera mucosa]